MVREINRARAAHGLAPLSASRSLHRSSRRYARRMMRWNYFGHASPIRTSKRFKRRGEVLGLHRGWRLRVRHIVGLWLRSPGHRRVILSRGFSRVGAGRSRGRLGRPLTTVWVVHVGAGR